MDEIVEKLDDQNAVDQEIVPESLRPDVVEIKKKKKRKSGIVVDPNAVSDSGISNEIKHTQSQTGPDLLILKGVPSPRPSEPTVLSPKEPNEVIVKLKHKGLVETKKFDLDFTARDIEEAFKLVRCHLEGNDHSARFPNKETGKYEKIDPKVEYVVFGHAYHADQIWKPKHSIKKVIDVQKGVVLKQGNLMKKQKVLLSDKWVQVYCKLQFCELGVYKDVNAQKLIKSYQLGRAKVVSEHIPEQPYAFLVFTPTRSWNFAASSSTEKEEWIEWIRGVAESYAAEDKPLSRAPSSTSVKSEVITVRERGSTTEDATSSEET